ncbi:MAG TPA: NAD(P)H-dependent oxidoreductase [Candidatus Omnitrophota bacterium]|jgi:NAD(P)H dehydrogenase (quinone)|nr:MAG: Glutathione-regulated potassium-efflux system ancillary protein KefF [Candidatus Omnitrophica bacterium ADurb.Bin314]HQB94315.1 NAD(P)H-dependent oxidoreductase [Candidatus Omnitrophota bacterium]
MNYLIVYSHPNPASFNHAIKETVVKALKDKGKNVRVRDVYSMRFDPVLKADDFETFQQERTPRDIEIEQEHVRWADVLIFIYPVWWAGMPAIARGYIDRVFSIGFAYENTPEGPKGLLTGKKVYVFNTMGAPVAAYEQSGIFKAIELLTDQETFRFCGLEVLGHKYFGSVTTVTDDDRKAMLGEVERVAASLV